MHLYGSGVRNAGDRWGVDVVTPSIPRLYLLRVLGPDEGHLVPGDRLLIFLKYSSELSSLAIEKVLLQLLGTDSLVLVFLLLVSPSLDNRSREGFFI